MAIASAEQLFAQIPVQSFIDEYLERQVLHLELNQPERADGLFGLEEMAECIRYQQPWHAGHVRVVPHGGGAEETPLLPLLAEEEGRVESFLLAGFAQKKTLVFNCAERYWRPVDRLVSSIQEALECRAICNIYCTPPASQGFDTHTDAHDVLVLQTHGSKVWRIHDVDDPLPIEHSPMLKRVLPNLASARPDYGEAVREVTLRPGDLLYLPRGVPHSAASTDEASVHLTIGLHPERLHQFVGKLVDLLAFEDEGLRRRVPIDAMRGETGFPDLPSLLRDLADRAEQSGGAKLPEQLLEILAEDHRPRGGHQGAVYSAAFADRIGPESVVEQTPGTTLTWRRTATELVVRCGGTMSLPLKVEPLIEFIAERRSFRVDELPDQFSTDGKVVLVRNLVQNSVLRLVTIEAASTVPLREAPASA
ncbi:MAG: cupin domain-containing protein [Acidobacteriota bacterium]